MAGMTAAAEAQPAGQSREDLLDALTRHIQICSEIAETQQRLECFDRLQTEVGATPAQAARPTPTPLQANPTPPAMQATPTAPSTTSPALGQPTPLGPPPGSAISSAPLAPQPLAVPGGGVATLGSGSPSISGPTPSAAQDPDAAFDPRRQINRPVASLSPRPQPLMRRTGPRAIPYSSTPQPLVTLGAHNLTYGDSRYWQVTVTLTSTTPRPISTQAQCTFLNGGRAVASDNLGPLVIQPGEQISTELIGPPTTTYVDSTNCRVVSP